MAKDVCGTPKGIREVRGVALEEAIDEMRPKGSRNITSTTATKPDSRILEA
jgi:hypothetical protein